MRKIGDDEIIYLIRRNNDEAKTYFEEKYSKVAYYWLEKSKIQRQDFDLHASSIMLILLNLISNYDFEKGIFYKYAKISIDRYIKEATYKNNFILYDLDELELTHPDILMYEDSNIFYDTNIDYIGFNDIEIEVIKSRLDGASYKQIADKLGISYKKVDNIIQKYKKRKSVEDIK